jgi:hypothetical protein
MIQMLDNAIDRVIFNATYNDFSDQITCGRFIVTGQVTVPGLIPQLVDIFDPVGSTFKWQSTTNPSTKFGGSWIFDGVCCQYSNQIDSSRTINTT